VRQRDASVRLDNPNLSAQFEARVSADQRDDDLSAKMLPLEQCFDWNKPLHSVFIARSRPVRARPRPSIFFVSPGILIAVSR
jgi:hypothetical protein